MHFDFHYLTKHFYIFPFLPLFFAHFCAHGKYIKHQYNGGVETLSRSYQNPSPSVGQKKIPLRSRITQNDRFQFSNVDIASTLSVTKRTIVSDIQATELHMKIYSYFPLCVNELEDYLLYWAKYFRWFSCNYFSIIRDIQTAELNMKIYTYFPLCVDEEDYIYYI